MNVPREQISVALFNLFANNAALKALCTTITRVPKIWSAVTNAELPYLLLFKGGPDTEGYSQSQAIGLTKYRLNFNLWLYLRSDATGEVLAETLINNVADAIDAAMQGNPPNAGNLSAYGQKQTLGGIVNNAWIEGGSEWGREFEDNNITIFWRIAVETGI